MDRRLVIFVGLIILISVVGLFVLYSATHQKGEFVNRKIFYRQVVWLALGFLFFSFVLRINYNSLKDFSFIFYSLSVLTLVLVELFGHTRLGSQRWLELWGFNFQPSELSKLAVILALSRFFCKKTIYQIKAPLNKLGFIKAIIIPLFLVLLPMFLVIRQPDLGTSLVLLFIFLVMIFIARIRLKYIVTFVLILILLMPVFWFLLRDYQKERLFVFINPDIDPLGAGYTIIQSKIAIGSGKILGKGWLSGTQNQLNFLPVRHTDFIFSVIGEEFGFMGVLFVLSLYFFLIRQMFHVINNCKDLFAQLLCSGILAMFLFQVVVNISMSVGIMPVVGLPLPLISYGGSSIIVNLVSLGILLSVHKQRLVF